jgi:hypothetical protein
MLRSSFAVVVVLLAGPANEGERTKDTFAKVANGMTQAINKADYEGLRADFNDTMLQAFPVSRCKQFFTGLTGAFGKFKSLGAPRFETADRAVFVARCDRGTLDFTLMLDGKGRVAAMKFVQHVDESVPDRNEVQLSLPFKGRWLVVWGGDTEELNHHHNIPSQRFAFDLIGAGPEDKTHKANASRNEDYYAFGREILAPADGVVTEAIDGVRDNVPGSMNPFSAVGNAVFIRHGKSEVSVLAHLKQGSVRVKAGDNVTRGQVLGLCGNSGNSSEPHLHYHLQNKPVIQDSTGIKCYFDRVLVEKASAKDVKQKYSPVKDDIISLE